MNPITCNNDRLLTNCANVNASYLFLFCLFSQDAPQEEEAAIKTEEGDTVQNTINITSFFSTVTLEPRYALGCTSRTLFFKSAISTFITRVGFTKGH